MRKQGAGTEPMFAPVRIMNEAADASVHDGETASECGFAMSAVPEKTPARDQQSAPLISNWAVHACVSAVHLTPPPFGRP